jgi:hypothetical protein
MARTDRLHMGNTEFYSKQSILQKKKIYLPIFFVGFCGSRIRFSVERCALTLSQIDIPISGRVAGRRASLNNAVWATAKEI